MLYVLLSMIYRQSRKERACLKCSCMGLISRLGLQFQRTQVRCANVAHAKLTLSSLGNETPPVAVITRSLDPATKQCSISLRHRCALILDCRIDL